MEIKGKFTKLDNDKFEAFGWASVAVDEQGNVVVDSQGDTISIDELERAAYEFVRGWATAGVMHERFNVAELIESVVFTPEKIKLLGLTGDVPQGWFVGFKIHDAETWQRIKNGELSMFSIGIRAVREAVQ